MEKNYFRCGEIPPDEKSLNFTRLNFEDRTLLTSGAERGKSPLEMFKSYKKNTCCFSNVSESEVFENGVSVFRESHGLPVLENIDQVFSLSYRLNNNFYIVSGEEVGKGQDGEPLIINCQPQPAEVTRAKLLKVIRKTLQNNFEKCEGRFDTIKSDGRVYRFYNEENKRRYITFCGLAFWSPKNKDFTLEL